jgi:ornithine cyclodeaminase
MLRSVVEAEVAGVLTLDAVRELMRDVLAASGRGDAGGPLRSVVPLGNAWFATMPAFVRGMHGGLGAKIVTVCPANAGTALPTHQAAILLADPQTGALVALVAGETITTLRTAAVSVVATQRLAARPRGTLAILGAGVQGRAHAEAFLAAGLIERLHIWSQSAERAHTLARDVSATLSGVVVAATPDACVAGADVIVTATAAQNPLFAATAVADGAHVNAVGACLPDRRELPADLVGAAAVYADSFAGAEREAGDLILAARDLGRERVAVAGELGAMLADPGRPVEHGRVTIFESLGLGLEDVACAAYVLERLTERP